MKPYEYYQKDNLLIRFTYNNLKIEHPSILLLDIENLLYGQPLPPNKTISNSKKLLVARHQEAVCVIENFIYSGNKLSINVLERINNALYPDQNKNIIRDERILISLNSILFQLNSMIENKFDYSMKDIYQTLSTAHKKYSKLGYSNNAVFRILLFLVTTLLGVPPLVIPYKNKKRYEDAIKTKNHDLINLFIELAKQEIELNKRYLSVKD